MKKHILIVFQYVDGLGYTHYGNTKTLFDPSDIPPTTSEDALFAFAKSKTPTGAIILNIIDLTKLVQTDEKNRY